MEALNNKWLKIRRLVCCLSKKSESACALPLLRQRRPLAGRPTKKVSASAKRFTGITRAPRGARNATGDDAGSYYGATIHTNDLECGYLPDFDQTSYATRPTRPAVLLRATCLGLHPCGEGARTQTCGTIQITTVVTDPSASELSTIGIVMNACFRARSTSEAQRRPRFRKIGRKPPGKKRFQQPV